MIPERLQYDVAMLPAYRDVWWHRQFWNPRHSSLFWASNIHTFRNYYCDANYNILPFAPIYQVVPSFELYQPKSCVAIKLTHSVGTSSFQVGDLTPLGLKKAKLRKCITLFCMKVSGFVRTAWRWVWVWSVCCNSATLLLGNESVPVPLCAPQITHGRPRIEPGLRRWEPSSLASNVYQFISHHAENQTLRSCKDQPVTVVSGT